MVSGDEFNPVPATGQDRARTALRTSARRRLRYRLSRETACRTVRVAHVPVDLGWEGLEFAQSMGVGRLSQADISQLPYASDSFDAVLSMDVIVHFPRGEEHRAFEELTRVLKPGGLFAVRVSALDMLRSRHSQFAHERQRFSRSRLLAAARDCGIQVERCTYANSLLMPIALAKFRVWEPLVAPEPASGVTPVNTALDNALYSALRFEAGWLGAGLNLPVGQSLILIGWKQ